MMANPFITTTVHISEVAYVLEDVVGIGFALRSPFRGCDETLD